MCVCAGHAGAGSDGGCLHRDSHQVQPPPTSPMPVAFADLNAPRLGAALAL